MSEFNEGDLVEAVKGENIVRGRLKWDDCTGDFHMHGWGIKPLLRDEYAVSVIEKAAPKLPTEPGLYIESGKSLSVTNIWSLSAGGRWLSAANSTYDGRAEEFAPFTRLEPVPVTAKKVLDAVRKFAWADGYMSQLDAVANQFGVPNV